MKKVNITKQNTIMAVMLSRRSRLVARDLKSKRRRERRKEKQNNGGQKHVILPTVVSLSWNTSVRKELINRIAQMKQYARNPDVNRLVIDLTKIEELHPCGTLLFIAELETLMLDKVIASKVHGKYPTNERVEQLFQHVGLIETLKLEDRIVKIADDAVVPWMFGSSCTSSGEDIAVALPKLLNHSQNEEISLCVTTGIAEAIANAEEHAYALKRDFYSYDEDGKKWWFFVKLEDEHLSVVICDLGAGIPRTLPINWAQDWAVMAQKKLMRKVTDGKCIEIGLEIGRTRSEKGYRGKGLQDILRIVEQYKVGMLTIHSNRGIYSCSAGRNQSAVVSKKVYNTSENIQGTLVLWYIPVSAILEAKGVSDGE